MRLRVEEVDQVNNYLRIRNHKGNPSGTRPPLLIEMHEDLKRLFRSLTPYNSEYWFSGRFSYRQWGRWTERAGIRGFEPFRGMRTSYVSWRIEEGANVSLLDVVLGHSTPVITQKFYNKARVATSQMIPNQRSVLGG